MVSIPARPTLRIFSSAGCVPVACSFLTMSDRVADARNLLKAVLRDDAVKRNTERKQIVGRARIGFGTERVAAAQGAALQGGDGGCVEGRHFIDLEGNSRSSLAILWSATATLSAHAVNFAPRPHQCLKASDDFLVVGAYPPWWPVPAGRIATSPAFKVTVRPFGPPNCTFPLPRAIPRTS
jgi:hypothetical protein